MDRFRRLGEQGRRGFTLVELLLVIAILGILAGTVVVSMSGRSREAQIQRAKMDVRNIEQAIEMFELQTGNFPSQAQGLEALINDPGTQGWNGPYLRSRSVPKDPWGNEYRYNPDGDRGQFFDLYSVGPNGIEGDEDDIGNWEEESI